MSIRLVIRTVLVLLGIISLVVDSATSEPMRVRIGGPLTKI